MPQTSERIDPHQAGPGLLERALHLAVLSSFAVAQPLLDVLAANPTFFVARRSEPIDLWILAAVLCLGVPLALLLLEEVVGVLGRSPRRWAHLVLVGFLLALALHAPVERLLSERAAWSPVLASAAGALGLAFLYGRWGPARTFLGVLAPAPLVFAGAFLFDPQIRALSADPDPVGTGQPLDLETPIVFVLFDELPLATLIDEEGEIDAGLFPHFARLAAGSTWFRNATAMHYRTDQVVPALLTGRSIPEGDVLPIAARYPESLFTFLGGSHRLVVCETITNLCPKGLREEEGEDGGGLAGRIGSLLDDVSLVYAHAALPARLTTGLPSVTENWGSFRWTTGERVLAAAPEEAEEAEEDGVKGWRAYFPDRERRARDVIASIDGGARPTLYYLHTLLPHAPWTYLPSGTQYFTGGEYRNVSNSEPFLAMTLQRHLLQVGFVDGLLGQLVEKLRSEGLYDRALIAVMADHGISFVPGEPRKLPLDRNVRDVLHVPFFLKLPFQEEGRVSDRNVESIDVLPTIADALGVELPWSTDGVSALDASRPARAGKTIRNASEILEVDAALPAHWPLLERKLRLFGSHPTWDDVFARGPLPGRVGSGVRAEGLAAVFPGTCRVDGRKRFAAVDLDSGLVPAYVSGSVRPAEGEPPEAVAVAINGVVRAIVPTDHRSPGEDGEWLDELELPRVGARFDAMVPEESFRDGENELVIYAFDPDGGLSPIREVTYSLAAAGSEGPVRILSSDGPPLHEVPGAAEGLVESVERMGEQLVLRGWAVDSGTSARAETVFVLVGGETVLAFAPSQVAREVAIERRSPEAWFSGFELQIPLSLVEEAGLPELRVLARGAGGVSELPFADGARTWEAN